MTEQDLLSRAEGVLRANDVGEYTKPSGRLYPHQWNWDSAFNALGWAHVDWERATREVEALLAAQWTNGMLPHIRYNPSVTDYAPGPEWWTDVPVTRAGEVTSGISQPPVLSTMVHLVGLIQPDGQRRRHWWDRVYDALAESLLYFERDRTTGNSPLIVLVHPWESGLDNSPRWDAAAAKGFRPTRPYRRVDTTKVAAAERPTSRDYDLYMFLVELIASHRYDMRSYLPVTPFAFYDAMFNAAWYRAVKDLNRIADMINRPVIVSDASLDAFRRAYQATLWDDEAAMFLDFDLTARAKVPVHSWTGIAAVYAGLVDGRQAELIYDGYTKRSRNCRRFPSVLPDQTGFESDRYHRGPVWVNANWMITRGLAELGLQSRARQLGEATIELVRRSGFYEYFDAYTGRGAGADQFSWTAALTIDLIKRPIV
ncbi:MAG: trehalase family glycosidase [bacterium]